MHKVLRDSGEPIRIRFKQVNLVIGFLLFQFCTGNGSWQKKLSMLLVCLTFHLTENVHRTLWTSWQFRWFLDDWFGRFFWKLFWRNFSRIYVRLTWTSTKCFTIQNCLITELTILFLLCFFHFEFNLILWIGGPFPWFICYCYHLCIFHFCKAQPNCQFVIVTLLTFSLTTHKSYAEASFKSLFACWRQVSSSCFVRIF